MKKTRTHEMKMIVVFLVSICTNTYGIDLGTPDTSLHHLMQQINDQERVEMEVHGFSDHVQGAYTVFLKEKKSDDLVLLPIVIGGCEAIALSRVVNEMDFPRPLTYDLFCDLLDSSQITLKAVVINELKQNTFYALIVIEQNGKKWELDARPSDAMNLALRQKCKIFSYRKVIEKAGIRR